MNKLLVILFFLFSILEATIDFPKLTGQVVDRANILSDYQESTLANLLKEHENQTSNQIVVVTINTLNGYDIAEYGYQLGRHWGIGQKDRNNGVLLIVAMNERKLRIEVGYGLEGSLTDKTAKNIIDSKIRPQFKKQNYYQGISAGVNSILESIKGEYKYSSVYTNNTKSLLEVEGGLTFTFLVIAGFFAIMEAMAKLFGNVHLIRISRAVYIGCGAGFLISILGIPLIMSSIVAVIVLFISFYIYFTKLKPEDFPKAHHLAGGYANAGGFSGSNFGGGFSGGGGSFGGGGASGGW